MISVLIILILALAGQCLGITSEQELVQFSGAHLASPSAGAYPHSGTSVVNSLAEPCDVRLDAEGLARSLPPADNPETRHRPVSPAKHELAITIDAETTSNSNKVTELRELDESSHAAATNQIQAEQENHSGADNLHSNIKQSTSCPTDPSILSQPEKAGHHREPSQRGDECAICLDLMGASIGPDLQCKHSFHEICILEWINNGTGENRFSCPKCRQPLHKKEVTTTTASPSPPTDQDSSFWTRLEELKARAAFLRARVDSGVPAPEASSHIVTEAVEISNPFLNALSACLGFQLCQWNGRVRLTVGDFMIFVILFLALYDFFVKTPPIHRFLGHIHR
ncbi:hypothetical protein PCANC_11660 [Puccinia coronata f. sp. avenae]|uniref:RING-type domain-containing protein n=1 Tax=Puccinia coronata f. sp. avenae TaxID=200324 RepID=A0A2N5VXG1_9BASI|nr:hypothetical protein PCANC_16627 [Puccinia coronata f. sp. avenae]PLW20166.1 hypothetical protein PCASD_17515 [Puccinia coronata f. sp. avenae]PLW54684.1 hypothetical protein PCANC_11660 [Puccinia coronata f. sp. avenae]